MFKKLSCCWFEELYRFWTSKLNSWTHIWTFAGRVFLTKSWLRKRPWNDWSFPAPIWLWNFLNVTWNELMFSFHRLLGIQTYPDQRHVILDNSVGLRFGPQWQPRFGRRWPSISGPELHLDGAEKFDRCCIPPSLAFMIAVFHQTQWLTVKITRWVLFSFDQMENCPNTEAFYIFLPFLPGVGLVRRSGGPRPFWRLRRTCERCRTADETGFDETNGDCWNSKFVL